MAKKYYQTPEFYKTQREWYAQLKADGFYDIEGGVEGHLLKGPTSSISLQSLANRSKADHGLNEGHTTRDFDDVADSMNEDINFSIGGKARYYHHAQLLAAQAFREGLLSAELCEVWSLHAAGEGERSIGLLMGIPRSRIRKYISELRHNIRIRIDNENT